MVSREGYKSDGCLAKDSKGAKVQSWWEGSVECSVWNVSKCPSFTSDPSRENNSEEGFAFDAIDDAGDAVLEVGFVEVDQESELERNQSKIVAGDFFEEIDDLRN
jgi:hypothetical protein